MFRVGLAIIVIGFFIQMFSGYTYTVASPGACPDEWDGEVVTSTEILDAGGNVAGYWCLIQGSFTQDNRPTFQNIPVGERSGYSSWYGFGVMFIGGIVLAAGIVRDRQRVRTGGTDDSGEGSVERPGDEGDAHGLR